MNQPTPEEAEELCGFSYDHDVPEGYTTCRECGADVSEWSDEE